LTEIEKEKTSSVSYLIFAATVIVVGINFVSVVFPALLTTSVNYAATRVDPFELGISATPVLIVNFILLGFGIAYYKKILPNAVLNPIKFLLKFEVSRRTALIVILIMLATYIAFTAQELSVDEGEKWTDFERIKVVLEDFPQKPKGGSLSLHYVQNFLLFSSQQVFQNVRVAPFIGTIALLIVTYFFTKEIAKKRFAGIVSMGILLQSFTFLEYDTTATYSNFWTLFYVLSLYMIYKQWYLSPVCYILSFFSKLLSALFLPMTLFFIYTTQISRRKKILLTVSYLVIIAIMVSIVLSDEKMSERPTDFDYLDFWNGFTTLGFQLRYDGLILAFLLPLTVALFLISRKGILEADSILVLIFGVLMSAPILTAFTIYDIHPYRYIPLVVFFAIGVGTLLSKKIIRQV